MTIVMATAVMGLARFAARVTQQTQESCSANLPGAGIIVRSEVLRLWLPQTLVELAKSQPQSPPLRTHAELQRLLEGQDQKALVVRRVTTRASGRRPLH